MKPIGTLYVKCDHFLLDDLPKKATLYDISILNPGIPYKIKSTYEYCPLCVKEMEAKQNDLQEKFDMTFGSADED